MCGLLHRSLNPMCKEIRSSGSISLCTVSHCSLFQGKRENQLSSPAQCFQLY